MDYKCPKCGGWLNTGYRCHQCGKWSPPPVETSAGTCTVGNGWCPLHGNQCPVTITTFPQFPQHNAEHHARSEATKERKELDGPSGSVFAVHSGEWNGKRQWHTGEFDRSHPPCGYVDDWSCAALWTVRDGAESHAEEFGGTVVEFRLHEVLPNAEAHFSEVSNSERRIK